MGDKWSEDSRYRWAFSLRMESFHLGLTRGDSWLMSIDRRGGILKTVGPSTLSATAAKLQAMKAAKAFFDAASRELEALIKDQGSNDQGEP